MEHENRMCEKHLKFTVSKSEFIIPPSDPLMSASPDGIIKCKCCGYGVLEIKCAYSCYDITIQERVKKSKCFCRKKENNGKFLSMCTMHITFRFKFS